MQGFRVELQVCVSGGWVGGPKVILVSVHILYVRFLGFKDFQDWTGPDTGLTISERIKILKLFELDNFGLKDQFGLVFVYFEQILMSFMITLIKECIANNYRCNIKPKITKNNYNWSKTKTFDEKYLENISSQDL